MSALMCFSMPMHQNTPLMMQRRTPSLTISSEAPCVLQNTRPFLPEGDSYSRTQMLGLGGLLASGLPSGFIESST